MWFALWTGGFLAGWLLARVGQFDFLSWSWLAFLLALLLLPRARHAWLWAAVGLCFGSYHSAPFPSQPLAAVRSVQHNPLQFFYSPTIATTSTQARWQVRSYPHSQGSVPESAGKQPHFIFPRPPHLRAELASGEQARRSAAELTSGEQARRSAAELASGEQARRSAAELTSGEQARRSAAELTSGEQARRSAAELTSGEQARRSAAELASGEQARRASPPPLVHTMRRYLLRQADNLCEPVHSWIVSITLGKRKDMPHPWREAFRLLGLFHVLVISGLHITIIAMGGKKLLDLTLRSLYVVRLLTPNSWLLLTKLASLLSCLLILFYGCLVGFSAPAQRAVLLFLAHQGCALGEHHVSLTEKIKLVFFLQMLLFPIGFLSDSLLLSWGAYLIVLHCFREVKHAQSCGGKLAATLRSQLLITALILCFFRELSVLSIPLNILLLPFIPYLVMSGFLLLLLPASTPLAGWIEYSHLFFLQQIARLAEIASTYSWLIIDLHDSPPLRVGLFVILILMVLRRSMFVTKRDAGRS